MLKGIIDGLHMSREKQSKVDFKDIAVIIPVREGSTRIQDKVTLPFAGTTLMEWKIEQLKKILSPEQIFVSTDSPKLLSIAQEHEVKIHQRDSYLCRGHEASFSEVICGIVKDIPYTHIAWVTVVVPLMSPMEYQEAFQRYHDNVVNTTQHDSLVSVNLLKEYFWNDQGPINYQADKNHTVSQDLPNVYRVTNGLYMRPKEDILSGGYFIGPNPLKFEVSKISGVDIDEIEDYHISTHLLGIYFEREIKQNILREQLGKK